MATQAEFLSTTRWGKKAGIVAIAASACLMSVVGSHVTAPASTSQSPVLHGVFTVAKWGDDKADKAAKDTKGKNEANLDPGSLYTIESAIGARTVWQRLDSQKRQITGQGVTVALLDSGTAAVPGLESAGKLTYGPDLSIEGNGSLTDQDTFGHGTHMAGIIAARDAATLTAKTISKLDPSVQLGVAPDAGLLSLKLATTDGSTDVSQVIAALDWVTEHQTSQNGSKVRVVNLSFGTDSVQSYQLDPLAAAAENAWRHGLVVVVSGGNDGNGFGRLTNPALDPYVIAVGASDNNHTVAGWAKPTVAAFSNGGTAARHVDLLAPGTSVASLRAPGSNVDVNHPEGLVSGDTTGRLFRGSGTSQAAAVVSGSVALLLQAYPNLTPDQVKALLTSSATPVAASALYAGAGQLNIDAALSAVAKSGSGSAWKGIGGKDARAATQAFATSTGQGSINAARGGNVLLDANGVALDGEVDVQGQPWRSTDWWNAASSLHAWSGGQWLGTTWTGPGWAPAAANGLQSARWSSARWSSARWSDADWSSARWSSARWSSARWSSARWSDHTWG
ncbi:S8 family serine peptidase [Jatrophihabitans telluris]|uniref:S8 family serine peptidase n=1 Tax=Jatrophihabitans telluris TaxID=2038343 RepID=A0ABY4QXP4_9ACTN|nr:S8 family serine peptidase [Jatrophihabitans telluris]UQX88428.1 S8 family serine peptidase [Jatrophihabitans telluris]